MANLWVQWDGRFIVRGPNGREHIFERSGQLVTTINERSQRQHENLAQDGDRKRATEDQVAEFRRALAAITRTPS